jgi:hypothetical protein
MAANWIHHEVAATADPPRREVDRMDLVETNAETLRHIRRVQNLLREVCDNLLRRAIAHDTSKLSDPELSTFAECTDRLRGMTYGSEEYKACLADMKPALDHHYSHNRHHPEHWSGGIKDMSLLDLVEMFVDWKAATERHADGDLNRSIEINQKRFGYGDELAAIFRRTVAELFPSWLEPWHCFSCGAGGCHGNFCYQCGAGKRDYEASA